MGATDPLGPNLAQRTDLRKDTLAMLSREAALLIWRLQGDFGEDDELTITSQ